MTELIGVLHVLEGSLLKHILSDIFDLSSDDFKKIGQMSPSVNESMMRTSGPEGPV